MFRTPYPYYIVPRSKTGDRAAPSDLLFAVQLAKISPAS